MCSYCRMCDLMRSRCCDCVLFTRPEVNKKNQCEQSCVKMNKASPLLSPLKAILLVSQRADDQALLPLFISSEAKQVPGQDTRVEESRIGKEGSV